LAWLHIEVVYSTEDITHPSTKQAQCSETVHVTMAYNTEGTCDGICEENKNINSANSTVTKLYFLQLQDTAECRLLAESRQQQLTCRSLLKNPCKSYST